MKHFSNRIGSFIRTTQCNMVYIMFCDNMVYLLKLCSWTSKFYTLHCHHLHSTKNLLPKIEGYWRERINHNWLFVGSKRTWMPMLQVAFWVNRESEMCSEVVLGSNSGNCYISAWYNSYYIVFPFFVSRKSFLNNKVNPWNFSAWKYKKFSCWNLKQMTENTEDSILVIKFFWINFQQICSLKCKITNSQLQSCISLMYP